jgi:hypothetical protein
VSECFSGVPPSYVTLEAHAKKVIKLPNLSPGIYRATIILSIGETFTFGKSFISSSPPFTVL